MELDRPIWLTQTTNNSIIIIIVVPKGKLFKLITMQGITRTVK